MDIVEKGLLVVLKNNKPNFRKYSIKTIDQFFCQAVLELQDEAKSLMREKYELSSESVIRSSLESGYSLGCFVEDRLVGIRLVAPCFDNPALCECLGVPKDELDNCVFLSGVYLKSEFTGNKIVYRMGEHILNTIDRERHFHIFTTVHPTNHPSLVNVLHLGCLVKYCGLLYGDKLRYIVHRDLRLPKMRAAANTELVLTNDIESNINLINQGFIGYFFVKNHCGVYLCYGK